MNMKLILLCLLFALSIAFSQNPADYKYRLTLCTTLNGIDYCAEHEAIVVFNISDDRIIVSRYGDTIVDMSIIGPWKVDSAKGERSVRVKYHDIKWTLTEREKLFVMDDHRCSIVEFWHGGRKSQHRMHGYVSVDMDDMFKFSELCEESHLKKPKKWKKKAYDSGKLIMASLFAESEENSF